LKRYRDHYPTYTSVLVAFELFIHRFKANLDRSILGLSIENIKTVRFYQFWAKKSMRKFGNDHGKVSK
jgi:hypothetical protein